ncbi:MAG: ribonuclease III [Candidatus Latescibacterota bacterium]|nr:MAG: ribonuclease III [Candidatus Latescibacterota bacterium]HDH99804.1 ribonuclease III [Bacillota bacterium]
MRWLFRLLGRRTDPRKERLRALQTLIGYKFKDERLLVQALSHRSYAYELGRSGVDSNERLEFLGDAVLNMVVADYLYRKFEEEREGALTQMKSTMVSKRVLARMAKEIGLGEYIMLGESEEASGGRERTSILGDAYEALVGAIYLDGGMRPVRKFLKRHLLHDMHGVLSDEELKNYKSALLELAQREGWGHPVYELQGEEGPDHRKLFTVEVKVKGQVYGVGQGRSKKRAEQMAAREALKRLEEEVAESGGA